MLSIDAINHLFFVFRRRRFVSNDGGVVFDVFFLTSVFVFLKCPEVRLGICVFAIARMMKPSIPKPTSGHLRFVRNSHCRCGCGGAQVFECVGGSMPRIERRRLTLDDRDDRRRDRVQRERPKVGLEFSNPTFGRKKNPIRPLGREKKILSTTTS